MSLRLKCAVLLARGLCLAPFRTSSPSDPLQFRASAVWRYLSLAVVLGTGIMAVSFQLSIMSCLLLAGKVGGSVWRIRLLLHIVHVLVFAAMLLRRQYPSLLAALSRRDLQRAAVRAPVAPGLVVLLSYSGADILGIAYAAALGEPIIPSDSSVYYWASEIFHVVVRAGSLGLFTYLLSCAAAALGELTAELEAMAAAARARVSTILYVQLVAHVRRVRFRYATTLELLDLMSEAFGWQTLIDLLQELEWFIITAFLFFTNGMGAFRYLLTSFTRVVVAKSVFILVANHVEMKGVAIQSTIQSLQNNIILSKAEMEEVELLANQVEHEPAAVALAGSIQINVTTIVHAVAAVATHLVIMLQFQESS